jgi:hypothetical protein
MSKNLGFKSQVSKLVSNQNKSSFLLRKKCKIFFFLFLPGLENFMDCKHVPKSSNLSPQEIRTSQNCSMKEKNLFENGFLRTFYSLL